MRTPCSGGQALALVLATFFSPSPSTAAGCQRSLLDQTVGEFIPSLSMGMAEHLQNLSPGFTYVENTQPMNISEGLMSKKIHVYYSRTMFDMQGCATFTEMVAPQDPAKPYVINVQIRHNASEDNNAVFLIDAVVATTGSYAGFDANETMVLADEKWGVIGEDTRDTRATLVAAGAMYLDLIETGSPFGRVAMGSPCEVLDGSKYSNCSDVGATKLTYSDRRSVVDETVGAINIFASAEAEDGKKYVDSHTLRLEGERVRYVHSLTVPVTKPER